MMGIFHASYFLNLDLRGKYFDGFNPENHLLALVGTIEVSGDRPESALEAAFQGFNRIDEAVPVLDEAEAPSMSVGDVCRLTKDGTDIVRWFVVASAGFTEIAEPTTISTRPVRELIDLYSQ